jgi:hypothetical protein
MVPDLARIRADQERFKQTVELNRAALELSRQRSAQITHNLAVVSVQLEDARRELRKCGLL